MKWRSLPSSLRKDNWLAYDIVFEFLKAFFTVEHAAVRMFKALKEAAMAPLEWIWNKLKLIADLYKQEGKFLSALLHGDIKGAVGAAKTAAGDVASVAGFGQWNHLALQPGGAAMAMRPSTIANSRSITSNRTTTATIGTINVNTPATDAQGIAKDIGGAIHSHGLVDQTDVGF